MSAVKRYCIDDFGSGMRELEEGPYVAFEDCDAQRLRADTAEDERDTERKIRESAEGGWREANRVIAMQRERLDAAEQRIAELVEFIRDAADSAQSAGMLKAFINQIDAALNPKPEAGSHEPVENIPCPDCGGSLNTWAARALHAGRYTFRSNSDG